MKLTLAFLFALCCGIALAQPAATNDVKVRFSAVDIFVDPQDNPLAAYQIEFTVTNGVAKIVGIEGGEHPAFREPPFYDPQAMQKERVIIAAFSTDKLLPTNKTRVATIHLQVSGTSEPEIELVQLATANSRGEELSAKTSHKLRVTK